MKNIILSTLLLGLISCGGKHGERDLKHNDVVKPSLSLIGSDYIQIPFDTAYTELGATSQDQRDGNLTNRIIISGLVDIQVLGEYKLTYTVRDNSGNEASTNRTIKIIDITAPVININGSSPMNVPFDTLYNELGATAIDDYNGNISSNIETTGYVNTQKLGIYPVTYTVKDSSGNESSITRTVIVEDIVKPTLHLLGNTPTNIEVHSSYTDAGAMAIDDYDGDISSSIQTSNNLNTAQLGSYTYTYNVTDSYGNAAIPITRTVTVEDTTPPVLSLIGQNPLQVELGATYTDPGANATDNYDASVNVVELINNIDMNTVGNYQIIQSSTDSSGNTSTITRNVQVRDTTPPALTITPTEIVHQLGTVTSINVLDGVSATDLQLSSLNPSTSVNTGVAGTTVVTYTATDSSGNVSTGTRTYKILDIPFLSMAKDSDANFRSSLADPRDFSNNNYSMMLTNNQLVEMTNYKLNTPSHFYWEEFNEMTIIPYDEEAVGKDLDIVYMINNNMGIHKLDVSSNTSLAVGSVIVTGMPTYTVDKAVRTSEGLYFSIGYSLYFVADNQSTAKLVTTINSANVIGSMVWSAIGKYLVTYEKNDAFPYYKSVFMYDIINDTKTMVAQEGNSFAIGFPEFSSVSKIESDGKNIFLTFNSYTYVMNETQLEQFSSYGDQNILYYEFNFLKVMHEGSYSQLFIRDTNLYGFVNGGSYMNVQKNFANNGYNTYSLNESLYHIHKVIKYKTDIFLIHYRDSAGKNRVKLLNITNNSIVNKVTNLTVYDTVSNQQIDLTGEFSGIYEYNGKVYLMPEDSDPLFSLSTDPTSKLIELTFVQP